ncbi:disease resistance protein RPV1-like isoform X2 [Tripterygium wilfordii]|uniref:disease resistance protein RPV1-like isoform X2 n=1 Tax=Tripterygium wilfordii TaxID=458696 RepID=UPI0018F7FBC2|nr:disease resistance protein RPV1-like isoform X2 [Tripterygium wilfordii]
MASSSTIHPPPQPKFDVFISFRGDDTRQNFLSHLHAALSRAKIVTFIDHHLNRGDKITEALPTAIEESQLSIVLFTENYANSRWCLDELVKILDCKRMIGQIVVPVFYNVNPSVVRDQTGSFAEAFAQHSEKNFHKISMWKDALKEAAGLSGWDSHVTSPDATLVDEIVKDVSAKLGLLTSSGNDDSFVGINERIQEIESLMSKSSKDVHTIGIWGMGESHNCGPKNLRKELLSAILNDDNLNLDALHIGLPIVRNRLQHKRVLVVFDDVNNFQHIQHLVGKFEWFGPGSIFIITSRDKQVLKNLVDQIYEVRGLNSHEALCLFSRYACREQRPPINHVWLSDKVIKYANGNPLAVTVLGSFLLGKSEEEQKCAMDKLERTPNMDVHKVLRISYDELDHDEKNIFLDIACFFKHRDVKEVKCLLRDCGFFAEVGICVLIDKSLIAIIHDNILWMHDLLQEMGREIVRQESVGEPGERSRLWDAEDVTHVLTKNTGTKAVRGILLDTTTSERVVRVSPTAFERMYNLRLLQITKYYWHKPKVQLPQGLTSLPDELRYLRWCDYPLTYLPTGFNPVNLVVLEMHNSHLEQLWHGRQDLPNLKHIDLSYSRNFIRIPDLTLVTNLETLSLAGTAVEELPSSIQDLTSLVDVNLMNCERLRNLPIGVGNWKCLQRLDLGGTPIEELPSSIECLTKLVKLVLFDCERLRNLPIGIGNLKRLKLLSLGGTLPIEELPSSIESLTELMELDLRDCKMLRNLPIGIGNLKCLKSLSLSGTAIEELPSSIENLIELAELDLKNCVRLRNLPIGIGNLKCLVCLSLSGTAIEELPSSIESLTKLVVLDLMDCKRLRNLPIGIGNLKCLESLSLGGTPIEELPSSIESLIELKDLYVDCKRLRYLPSGIGNFKCLGCLYLSGTLIEELPPSIESLTELMELDLRNCERLGNLPIGIGNLKCLGCLYLSGTPIAELPSSIESLTELMELDLKNCERLRNLPIGIGNLKCLLSLNLSGTPIEELPSSIENLIELKTLDLRDCKRLRNLPIGIGNLKCLQYLYLSGTPIEELPSSIDCLTELVELDLRDCKRLRNLPIVIGNFKRLNYLLLSGTAMEDFEFDLRVKY